MNTSLTILACDTTQQACSVALVKPNGQYVEICEIIERGHTEILPVMMQKVMKKAESSWHDIDRLAVTLGPGTFAGVRIGLAAMRALALVCSAPVQGVGTLEVLAYTALQQSKNNLPVAVVIDARRHQIYGQLFAPDLSSIIPARAVSPEVFIKQLPKTSMLLIGTAVHLIAPFIEKPCYVDVSPYPQAYRVACLAMMCLDFDKTLPPPSPIYLRSPEATLPMKHHILQCQ